LRIIRAHRLWEEHLAEETGFTEAEWHGQAEYYEHILTPEETRPWRSNLATHLRPHGDPIPTHTGELKPHAGVPLTAMPVDAPLRIVHIEDEPEAVYAQLVAEGLFPGMNARLTEISPQRLRLWAGGDEHILAPVVAANISVVPLAQEIAAKPNGGFSLSDLATGEQGTVIALSPRFRGAERRRMLDLGILPGPDQADSPSGDPTATGCAAPDRLRKEQARLIQVIRLPQEVSATDRSSTACQTCPAHNAANLLKLGGHGNWITPSLWLATPTWAHCLQRPHRPSPAAGNWPGKTVS
jgi:DtxR family Mn-dependent transcriptional regulator